MKPLIGIPMGDPAGIGPEIVVRAVSKDYLGEVAHCVVYGEAWVMEEVVKITGVDLVIRCIDRAEEAHEGEKGVLYLVDLTGKTPLKREDFKRGCINGACGKAAYLYIEQAVKDAMEKRTDAIATAPVNKESFREGEVPYIGHTEILAGLTETEDPLTMFEVRRNVLEDGREVEQNLRVFFLSRHVSLRNACDMVTKERIKDYVERCIRALSQLGIRDVRMAVAGLNPHGGEHGLFGDEEDREVRPAVEELKEKGFQVEGPVGADSVFHQALTGRYDAVLSLYHDQGHIATKTLDFYRTIALTLGMPILRTSVDHGTAFDIAGQGIASSVSMEEAIYLAAKYSGISV